VPDVRHGPYGIRESPVPEREPDSSELISLRGRVGELEHELERASQHTGKLEASIRAGLSKSIESEQLLRLVASLSDYAIFLLDRTGHVATWTPGAQRFKGYRAEEIVGRHFSVFYPREEVEAGKCEMELEVAERVGHFHEEGWRIRKDGSRFWADVVITAIHDASGALVGFGKVARDLTLRRDAEEERARRVIAEETNRTKDEFLAMLGHEMRNPLAPIVTALQLAKLRGETKIDRELKIIERQVEHMSRLVDDLLDVSGIARGAVELNRRPFDLRDAVARAVEIASPLIEAREHRFDVDVSSRPLPVDGDEARLVQVFANLLSNAAKYTDPGGHVRLSIDVDGPMVRVQVRDDGTGIAPELLPRVFSMFVQGEQPIDRRAGGLGLGLALVRSLTELHGGRVGATSALGKGSVFSVWIPSIDAARTDEEAEPASPDPVPAPRVGRILIVDDNVDAALLLGDLLTDTGYDVRTAHDGTSALALLDGFAPDVAILDIGLPDMTGHELARRVRASTEGVHLIALSGYGQESDRRDSAAAGFDLHMVKPVHLQGLMAAIASGPKRD